MNNDNTVETGRIAGQNCQGSYATADFSGLGSCKAKNRRLRPDFHFSRIVGYLIVS